MIVFELLLNGKLLARGGGETPHVHQVWEGRALQVGDELTLRIVEDSIADEPETLENREA